MKALDADETLAQLLATEGFESVEEIAFVEHDDLASIEGFNDEIAEELQTRAREFLERQNEELNAKRLELGVEDAVLEMDGVSLQLAVIFGENDIKTVEDVAGLVPDDLTGWREPGPDGKPVFQAGLLPKGDMSADEAELFVMRARHQVGWIDDEQLAELEAQFVDDDEAEEGAVNEFGLTEEERALMALDDIGNDALKELADLDESDFSEESGEEGADEDADPQ